jgi:hypothetical protein
MAQEADKDPSLPFRMIFRCKITQAHRGKTTARIMFTMLQQDIMRRQERRYI